LIAAGLYFISVPTPLSAQDPEVVGTITAELVEVLSASEISPLGFGRFFIDGEGTGSIIVSAIPSVYRTTTGSSVHLQWEAMKARLFMKCEDIRKVP